MLPSFFFYQPRSNCTVAVLLSSGWRFESRCHASMKDCSVRDKVSSFLFFQSYVARSSADVNQQSSTDFLGAVLVSGPTDYKFCMVYFFYFKECLQAEFYPVLHTGSTGFLNKPVSANLFLVCLLACLLVLGGEGRGAPQEHFTFPYLTTSFHFNGSQS